MNITSLFGGLKTMRTLSQILTAIPLILSTTGCISHGLGESAFTRYHDDGRAKPVAIVPAMIDTTSLDLPWSLAEELTTAISQEIVSTGQVFIQQGEEITPVENPFGSDLSWIRSEFSGQPFAIFLELVEHDYSPSMKSKDNEPSGEYLNMGVRVRVVDLRSEAPKIVLQEVIRDHYYIPKTLFPPNYQLISWGCEEYKKTPMGIAHSRLSKEVAARITDYLLLAQSR